MRDYDAIDWMNYQDSWHEENYSYGVSELTITCKDFFTCDDDFLCLYDYDVNLIFNI